MTGPAPTRRISPWGAVVALSALLVVGALSPRRARQRPGGRADVGRDGAAARLSRLGAHHHSRRRRRGGRLLRVLAAGAGRGRRHRRERRVRAAEPGPALDRRFRPRLGPAGPLPGRGREHERRRARQRRVGGRRRAVLDPGAQQQRRRRGGGPAVIAALALDRRLQRAAGAVAYLAANVVIAIVGICAVLGVMLGAALSVVRIGLPLLLASAAGCRWLLRADRRAANRFLHMQIPPQPAAPRTSGTPWRRTLAVLSDRMLLRTVAILAAKPLLIAVLVAVALVPFLLLAEIVNPGVQGVGGLGSIDYLGPWSLGVGLGVVLCLLVPPAALLVVATLDALHTLLCK